MAKGRGQINGWITKNGVHIPIYGEYTVRGGVEPKAKGSKFKRRKRPEEFDKDIRESGGKYWAAHSSAQGKKQGVKDLDKPFDTKEEARAFLAKENGEYEDAKFTGKAESKQVEGKKLTSFQEQVNDRFKTKREWDEIAKNAGYKDSSDPEFQKNADDIVAKNKQESSNTAYNYNGQTITHHPNGVKPAFHGNEEYNYEVHPAKGEKGANQYFKTEQEAQDYINSRNTKSQESSKAFRDKKAQEQGFADDASMRSYNEETGVNRETWKGQESSAEHKQQLLAKADADAQKLKRSYRDTQSSIQDHFSNSDEPLTYSAKRVEGAEEEGTHSNYTIRKTANGKNVEMSRQIVKDSDGSNVGDEILYAKGIKETGIRANHLEKDLSKWNGQESSKSSFSPESSAQVINDMARRRANGGGKNDDWKTAQSVLESAPAGTTMIQTGNRGVKFQYTKGDDDKWHSTSGEEYTKDSKTLSMSWVGQSGPSVEFTTSDKALTKDQIKDSHTAAVNGRLNQHLAIDNNGRSIGNRSVPKVDNSLTPQSVKEQTKRDVQAKLESNYAKVKKATSSGTEKVTATPKSYSDMTVSGLKEALAGARPGDKTKIRAELRKRGYTYIGGKWVKGSKS